MTSFLCANGAVSKALAACRYKGVPGLQALHRAFPNAKWYIMIGALVSSLIRVVAGHLDMY